MVPAAIPASRAMSDIRELKYPFRAKTRTAASMICWGLSGSRMIRAESPFILWAPAVGVNQHQDARDAGLTSPVAARRIAAHGDQVSHRHHAGALASRPRRGRVPLDALRFPRAERHRLPLALRPPLLAGARPRGHDHP